MIIDIKDYMEMQKDPVEGCFGEVVTTLVKSPLEQQFDVMEEQLKGSASIHMALIEMTNLIKMFYYYLEGKKHD